MRSPRVGRLVLGALAPLLLTLLFSWVGSAAVERSMMREALQLEAQTLSHLGADLAAAPLEFQDEQSLSELITRVSDRTDFAFLAVLDAEGGLHAYRGDAALRDQWLAAVRSGDAMNEDVLWARADAVSAGKRVGVMAVGLHTRTGQTALVRRRFLGAVGSLFAAGVALAVVMVLVRIIRAHSDDLEQQRRVLRETGRLARVGGWELRSDRTQVLSDEAREVLGDRARSCLWELLGKQGAALETCLALGQPFDVEVEFEGGRWLRVQGQAERDAAGVIVRVRGALQEITEQRAAREHMLASRAKSQFLANTSHEMRTPLNGIIGMTTLALESSLTAEQRSYLETVLLSGRSMLATVNDLLDLSRIEAGKLALESAPMDVYQLVVEATRTLSTIANSRHIDLVVAARPGVSTQRRGDAARLTQVVINLVGNAVKFTPRGAVECLLEELPDGTLVLSVRDTGIGIPRERQQAIFEAFTQADGATNRSYGGAGLGLTITRELVELMGGSITLESELGRGSTFTVRLPLERLPAPPQSRSTTSPPCALIVSGSPTTARALEWALQRLGVQAVMVESIGEALARPEAAVIYVDRAPVSTLDPRAVVLVPFGSASSLRARTLATPFSARDVDASLSAPLERAGEPVATAPQRVLEVLLAEDNVVNARLASALVSKAGHRVTHVTNGKAALDALVCAEFDLVLMDLQMPELDGLEATRQWRAMEKGGPRVDIIAMTANAMASDELACREAGMDGFFAKPIDVERLRALLAACASRARREVGSTHPQLALAAR